MLKPEASNAQSLPLSPAHASYPSILYQSHSLKKYKNHIHSKV